MENMKTEKRKLTEYYIRLFVSPELPKTSITPSGCKKKINKYCLFHTKGLSNIKNKTKQKC